MDRNARYYQALYTIRRFESLLLEKFPSGVFHGTTHTSLGQEANAVGVLSHLQEEDVVVSNHRCHGHFLAYGGDPQALYAELMGKPSGVCGGVGGSQHLHWRNFYSNGIQGGTVAMASGMALGEKRQGRDSLVVVFMGDGTLGQGVVYECLNMVSLWQLPLLLVLENNQIAQTTPIRLALAGEIPARFAAFGIPTARVDSSDVLEISPLARDLLADIRVKGGPRALVIRTARLGTHSKGDDTRPRAQVTALWRTRDPLAIHGARLAEDVRQSVELRVEERIQRAFEGALTAGGVPDV
jgi:TPP-dependent pyruvate/acetoin dehydrogenase alpha subunit